MNFSNHCFPSYSSLHLRKQGFVKNNQKPFSEMFSAVCTASSLFPTFKQTSPVFSQLQFTSLKDTRRCGFKKIIWNEERNQTFTEMVTAVCTAISLFARLKKPENESQKKPSMRFRTSKSTYYFKRENFVTCGAPDSFI